ncbi:MAG: ankyrin repeat domain-containing protein [Acidimicrobiia bacterium]|nr:ankyrin repeat domain-containing protein [Acidimicrobiia bacterium]
MPWEYLPFFSSLNQFQKQADLLLDGHRAKVIEALRIIHHHHPRFMSPDLPWLPRDLSPTEIAEDRFDVADARLAVARGYCFFDWQALAVFVEAAQDRESEVYAFESAVEAVISGDLPTLRSLLQKRPELVRARSTRRTNFDPPRHRATLLHYVAANGVENYRQKTPENALQIAETLLEAGAEADALADLYGTECTTMSLLVSSCHPAEAGVQVPLIHLLLDHGAAVEGRGSNKWSTPLMTALIFGYPAAAEALRSRGAKVDNIAAAAGLGLHAEAGHLISSSDRPSRHRALALAAQLGHARVVRLLLDSGEDPSRYNPDGYHAHATPLHQAALAGHEAVVRLLVERGASLEIKDKIYQSTPLGWANHAGKSAITELLEAAGGR